MENNESSSIKEAINDLLDSKIFREIAKRNNREFTEKLAIWLIRYILIISSMNESLKIDLEEVLLNLHGEKFKKILEVTEKTFNDLKRETDNSDRYIW